MTEANLKNLRDKLSMDNGCTDNRDRTYCYSELPKNEFEFGLERDNTNYDPKKFSTMAMTDKQFDSNI